MPSWRSYESRSSHPPGGGSGRGRDGRADRRPSGQRRRAGGVVRPAGDRRRSEWDRHPGHRPSGQAESGAAGGRGTGRTDPARQLRPASGGTPRLRPADRGHRRAPGLESRSLPARRAVSQRTGDTGHQHLRSAFEPAGRSAARPSAPALLRHPFFQSAALHGAGGADSLPDHRSGASRSTGDLSGQHPGQERGPRQGYPELHRQPHRRFFPGGDDSSYPSVRAGAGSGGCLDRSGHRPAQERHLPHRRSRRFGYRGSCVRGFGAGAGR